MSREENEHRRSGMYPSIVSRPTQHGLSELTSLFPAKDRPTGWMMSFAIHMAHKTRKHPAIVANEGKRGGEDSDAEPSMGRDHERDGNAMREKP
jgi:hypothetical protein